MGFPLILAGMALAGAAKGIAAKKAQSNAIKSDYAAREDERQRQQSAFKLTQMPQLQGAEKRTALRDSLFSGFLGNFARDAQGNAKSQRMADIFADPYHYRSSGELEKLSPYAAPLPKVKTPGFMSYLGAGLGGAAEGAGSYYAGGGTYGMGGAAAANPSGFGALEKGLGSKLFGGAKALGALKGMGTSVGPTAVLAGNLKRGNFTPMPTQQTDDWAD